MKSIKTYLLPLFILAIFSAQAFSQGIITNDSLSNQKVFSKADSVLAESYLTEIDYNELKGDGNLNVSVHNKTYYGDEIYNEEPIKKSKRRNFIWDSATAELVVDVVVNTVFLIAAFWH